MLNTFKILGLQKFDFSYKKVRVDGLEAYADSEQKFNTAFNKAATKLSSKLGKVVIPIYENGKKYLAVSANTNFQKPILVNTCPLTATLTLLPEKYKVDYNSRNKTANKIICNFLQFAIKKKLGSHPMLGKIGSSDFISKVPVDIINGVEIYEGFSFKVVQNTFYTFDLVLDTHYSFLEKEFLSELINSSDKKKTLSKNDRFMYLNGDSWYVIEIDGYGDIICKQQFSDKDNNEFIIKEYILGRNKHSKFKIDHLLNDNDISILYKYPLRDMQPHFGASSLAKRILPTNDERVKSIHNEAIKKPNSRFNGIEKMINTYFRNLKFNTQQLLLSEKPRLENQYSFDIPNLKFNGNHVVRVSNKKSNVKGVSLKNFRYERKNSIENYGILNEEGFDPQFLFVPVKWNKPLWDTVQKEFHKELKKYAPDYPDIDEFQIIPYTFDKSISAKEQVERIAIALEKYDVYSGYGIFILPNSEELPRRNYIKDFHDLLKDKFRNEIWFQCASADNVQKFFKAYPSRKDDSLIEYKLNISKERSFKSYMSFLALEFLILQRKWAYCLEESLHYDIYIGIDCGGRNAGVCIFFRNGEKIIFNHKRIPKPPKNVRAEKIKADDIVKLVLPFLKNRIRKYAPNPNGIIIVQDGKSYGENTKALKSMINTLVDVELVKKDIEWAVVDLHKNSATPLRVVTPNNSFDNLSNPIAGTYKLYDHLDEPEGFLFNTGYPFSVGGTVKPIQLIYRNGTAKFINIMEDLFRQAMMPLSAPNLSNSLPICIKLIDTFLQHTGSSYDARKHIEQMKSEEELELIDVSAN